MDNAYILRIIIIVVIVVLLVLLLERLAHTATHASKNSIGVCKSDADCSGDNGVCDKGKCVQCALDSDCNVGCSGNVCSFNQCFECLEDNHCPQYNVCIDRICIPLTELPCECPSNPTFHYSIEELLDNDGDIDTFAEGIRLAFNPRDDVLWVPAGPPGQPMNQFLWEYDRVNHQLGDDLWNGTGHPGFDSIIGIVWHEEDELWYSTERQTGNLWSWDSEGGNVQLIGFAGELNGMAVDTVTGHLYATSAPDDEIFLIDRTTGAIINSWLGLISDGVNAIYGISHITKHPNTDQYWVSFRDDITGAIGQHRLGIFDPVASTITSTSCYVPQLHISSFIFDNLARMWVSTGGQGFFEGDPVQAWAVYSFPSSPCAEN